MRGPGRGRTKQAIITGAGILAAAFVFQAGVAFAGDFTVTGRFLYEDRVWDQFGYTGTVQNLPIRFADVEVVKSGGGGGVIAAGSTDADGNYSILVTGQNNNINLYVRCLSATDNSTDYHITVADTFVRTGGTTDITASVIHSITTDTVTHNTSNPNLDMGDYLIQDTTGMGVAQAFNMLDNAVDGFDFLASPDGIARYPTAGEFVVFGWDPPQGSGGSNYFWQGIFITANESGGDTDGWSDTVILHEMGHWANDMFTRDDNPGGSHFLGDNNQDPRLSYGEGYATFYCAQVREFRAPRLNPDGQPVDDHVSFYADLAIPPALPTPGSLEFAYDFETGLFQTGTPIGQLGTANETNVTSVMWDIVDGVDTPDESPGVDDEPGDDSGALSWAVLQNYMTLQGGPGNWITIEDYYDGWFATHGAGFMQAEVDSAFIGLACMKFFADANEPDGDIGSAPLETVLRFTSIAGSGVKINEIDQGPNDSIEFLNSDTVAVDMTGWVFKGDRNGSATAEYTFPQFTLHPGCMVVLHEGGSLIFNGPAHLYAEGLNFVWANGGNGAASLLDSTSAARDFVSWDHINGTDPDTTMTPPGTGWTGTLLSAPGGKNLGRDENGTDTDDASDWATVDPSLGSPNFAVVPLRTLYPAADLDMVKVEASPGDLLVIQAEAPHSAGEPRVELFDSMGSPLGSAAGTHGFASLAEMQFVVGADTVFYARVAHLGQFTDYALYNLRVFTRPVSRILNPPVAVLADPENENDTADTVHVTWLNGGDYDQVGIFRDGLLRATLVGSSTSFTDVVSRGNYEWGILGVLDGELSDLGTAEGFAGLLSCYLDDGLEAGTSNFNLDSPWDRVNTIVESGDWSLHDSPGGNYGPNLNISARVLAPVDVQIVSTLEFDHICITESTFDFGIVEISADNGGNWTELARSDMDDHPGGADGVPDAGDWVHESFLLDDYLGEKVLVRFRLETDLFVEEDGWYIDNIQVSDNVCRGARDAVPYRLRDPQPTYLLRLAGPNPFSSRLGFSLNGEVGAAARVQVFDTQGRLVATVFDGWLPAGRLDLAWDGRNDSGRPAAAGFYLLRAATSGRTEVHRVVKLP